MSPPPARQSQVRRSGMTLALLVVGASLCLAAFVLWMGPQQAGLSASRLAATLVLLLGGLCMVTMALRKAGLGA